MTFCVQRKVHSVIISRRQNLFCRDCRKQDLRSFFARSQLEHLGCWIARAGIKPAHDKVKAVSKIAEPKTRKELRSFVGACQMVPCTGTFGCTDVQNNQVEMGTTTPKGICDGQTDHCKGDAVSLSQFQQALSNPHRCQSLSIRGCSVTRRNATNFTNFRQLSLALEDTRKQHPSERPCPLMSNTQRANPSFEMLQDNNAMLILRPSFKMRALPE